MAKRKKAPISAIPVGKVTDSGAAWIAYGTINAPSGNKLQGFQDKWNYPELEQREGQTWQSQAPKGTDPPDSHPASLHFLPLPTPVSHGISIPGIPILCALLGGGLRQTLEQFANIN